MDACRHLQDGAPLAQPQGLTTLWGGSLDRSVLAPFDQVPPAPLWKASIVRPPR